MAPFTHIFNLYIMSGIVAIELKIARVVPQFKSDRTSLSFLMIDQFLNYLPFQKS